MWVCANDDTRAWILCCREERSETARRCSIRALAHCAVQSNDYARIQPPEISVGQTASSTLPSPPPCFSFLCRDDTGHSDPSPGISSHPPLLHCYDNSHMAQSQMTAVPIWLDLLSHDL